VIFVTCASDFLARQKSTTAEEETVNSFDKFCRSLERCSIGCMTAAVNMPLSSILVVSDAYKQRPFKSADVKQTIAKHYEHVAA
jgi:hypothetical protein